MSKSLFGLVRTITVGSRHRFVVKDHFVKDSIPQGREIGIYRNIVSVGENFLGWFGEMIEEPTGEIAWLHYAKLLEPSLDETILEKLGVHADVSLGNIFGLMKAQSNREKGALLTNGRSNVFYAKDAKCTRRPVRTRWHGGGWNVDAGTVLGPRKWGAGSRVFFPLAV